MARYSSVTYSDGESLSPVFDPDPDDLSTLIMRPGATRHTHTFLLCKNVQPHI